MLQCALVNVCNPIDTKFNRTCVLFDSCSQRTYITTELQNRLQLTYLRTERLILKTFSSADGRLQDLNVYQLCVKGRNGVKVYVEALCVPYICSSLCPPSIVWIKNRYVYLRDLELAEPPTIRHTVDILVGLDYLYSFCSGRHRHGPSGSPVAVESILGWLVCGPIGIAASGPDALANLLQVRDDVGSYDEESDLRTVLKDFWMAQEVSGDDISVDDMVLQRFNETIYFNGTRYVTGLPLKSKDDFMPDNYRHAHKRFLRMVASTLNKDPELKREYINIFDSYERDNMIEEVHDSGIPGKIHYLPHRPVVRSDKETTRVRPVFDASSKEKGGKSLNDFFTSWSITYLQNI